MPGRHIIGLMIPIFEQFCGMIMSLPQSFSQYTNGWKAFSLALGMGVLILFGLTLQFGYEESFLILNKSWGKLWDAIMPHLTHLADGAMVGGVFGLIYARRSPGLVLGLLFSLVLVALSVALLKHGVFAEWHRPPGIFDQSEVNLLSLGKENRFSFPSGHSAAAACLGWYLSTVWRKSFWGIMVGMTTVFLGFTRVYIGVHFPGDVAAGLVVGLLLAIVGTFFASYMEKSIRKRSELVQKSVQYILAGLALLFLLFGIVNTITKYYLP